MTLFFTAPKEPTIPTSYLLRTTVHQCLNCGSAHTRSEFLAMSLVRSRNGSGAPMRHYEPVKRATWNIPIERVAVTPQSTAYCAECPSMDLSGLPEPPSAARLHDMPELALRGAKAPRTTHTPPPRKPTLEDLA